MAPGVVNFSRLQPAIVNYDLLSSYLLCRSYPAIFDYILTMHFHVHSEITSSGPGWIRNFAIRNIVIISPKFIEMTKFSFATLRRNFALRNFVFWRSGFDFPPRACFYKSPFPGHGWKSLQNKNWFSSFNFAYTIFTNVLLIHLLSFWWRRCRSLWRSSVVTCLLKTKLAPGIYYSSSSMGGHYKDKCRSS
jgi:hypothetical protein